jgi:osmotically-inducible protein OsmY
MSARPVPKCDLGRRVRAALTVDPRTSRHAREIAVSCDGDGEVTLRGVVPRLRARGAATVAASSLAGVRRVHNLILVGPADRSDDDIARIVTDALIQEPSLDERRIGVSVADGIVRLTGEVESLTHLRLACALPWWVQGVRGVESELETRQETTADLERDDEVLEAGIDIILDKDPLVDGVEVKTVVRDGVATLAGTVGGQVSREAAEDDAWATPGVRDVRNEIVVSLGTPTVLRRAS